MNLGWIPGLAPLTTAWCSISQRSAFLLWIPFLGCLPLQYKCCHMKCAPSSGHVRNFRPARTHCQTLPELGQTTDHTSSSTVSATKVPSAPIYSPVRRHESAPDPWQSGVRPVLQGLCGEVKKHLHVSLNQGHVGKKVQASSMSTC